jgi:uncharacterized protein (TIGR02246 family)
MVVLPTPPAASPGSAPAAGTAPAPLLQAAHELVEAYQAAFNAHDARRYARLFGVEGEFVNLVGQVYCGPAAIEAYYAPLFSGQSSDAGHPSYAQAQLTARLLRCRQPTPGLLAADVGWTQTGLLAPDGVPMLPRQGLTLWLLRPADTGAHRWLICLMHMLRLPSCHSSYQ